MHRRSVVVQAVNGHGQSSGGQPHWIPISSPVMTRHTGLVSKLEKRRGACYYLCCDAAKVRVISRGAEYLTARCWISRRPDCVCAKFPDEGPGDRDHIVRKAIIAGEVRYSQRAQEAYLNGFVS
jgi:hypothetical protein